MPAGALLDRFGFGRVLFGAVLLIALSGALRSFADGHLSLFLAVGVFGLGGPLVSIGGPKLITRHFAASDHGFAMGIYTTGPVVGGIVALSLTNSLVMPLLDHDWRAVLQLYAGVTFVIALAWFAIGGNEGRSDGGGVERQDASQLAVFARLLRLRVVQLTLLMGIGIFFFNHALNNWLPEILRAGGMDAVRAGHWAAIPTAVGIVGALTIPRLATGSRRLGIMVVLALCAGVATLFIPASGWILALGLVLQGIARGAMMAVALMILMGAKEIGPRLMGAAGGLFFTAAEIGGVLGPLTVGWLAERSGGFTAPLWMLFGDCVILILLAVIAARSRPDN